MFRKQDASPAIIRLFFGNLRQKHEERKEESSRMKADRHDFLLILEFLKVDLSYYLCLCSFLVSVDVWSGIKQFKI